MNAIKQIVEEQRDLRTAPLWAEGCPLLGDLSERLLMLVRVAAQPSCLTQRQRKICWYCTGYGHFIPSCSYVRGQWVSFTVDVQSKERSKEESLSEPEQTRPKMVCLPSRAAAGASVMKNWEPFVSGPLFAIESTPAPAQRNDFPFASTVL